MPQHLRIARTPAGDLVGRLLADRYRILARLGEGGMGSVYLAEHVALRKRVAIKVLHRSLAGDPVQVDRFLQEARAASMIAHENVVDILDFGSAPDGSVFFAMEHLEGEDLAQLLRREGRLPWPRAREMMLQVVRALGVAHDMGIVHRDLKPANCFLVHRPDGRGFVKLLDFGIARVVDPDTGARRGLTRTGSVFGTAAYMAPEQACGEPADARTDVYATAVCLYELLTGTVPFEGDNFIRVLNRHLTDDVEPPSVRAPDAHISTAVDGVIAKALAKRRGERYANMRELEAALLAIGPDGGLVCSRHSEPPLLDAPSVGATGVERTMWLGPQGAAPAVGPTVMLPPPEAPAASIAPASHSIATQATAFAVERGSPVKVLAMLVGGAVLAIVGGAIAGMLVLGDEAGEASRDASPAVAEAPPAASAVAVGSRVEGDVGLRIDVPVEEVAIAEAEPKQAAPSLPEATPSVEPVDVTPTTERRRDVGPRKPKNRAGASTSAAVPNAFDRPLDPTSIRAVVREHMGEVRACYDMGATMNPGLSGKVWIRFTVGADGRVTRSTVDKNKIADPGVGECIAKAVARWTFPKPSGSKLNVLYPFTLAPS